MDKSDDIFVALIAILIVAVITGLVVDIRHDTEHVYWTSDTTYEAIDEGIEGLVTGEIDSLIVTHPGKPSAVGYVYFRKE